MRQLQEILDRLESALIALLAGAALVLACFAMATRYFAPGLALDWSFELVIFAAVWATFLASARMAGHGGHVRVDILLRMLPASLRTRVSNIGVALSLGVALFLLGSGVIVTLDAFRWDERTMSTLQLPLWTYYLCLPVSALLSSVHLGARLGAGDNSEADFADEIL